ncbi:stealth family protein [Pediococcus argentinicus]|uniref:stealth family protein n=1 Tax=Pediococcus argentinicus TaxID=480391 RepID=UPI00338EF824
MTHKVDIVIPWVDSSDPIWQEKFHKYSNHQTEYLQNNKEDRFRDYGTLRFLFRSIDKYADWINNIFLVTDNQVPDWLNTDRPDVKIIDHKDIINEEFLPTFNSNVIEWNIVNIMGLSDNFILANDDMLFTNRTEEKDFFKNDNPRDYAILSPVFPSKDGIDHTVINNLKIINNRFNKKSVIKSNFWKFYNPRYGKNILRTLLLAPYSSFCGFWNPHLPQAFKKSDFITVIDENKQDIKELQKNKFRTNSEVNQWLVRYYNICTGHFSPRRTDYGKFFSMDQLNDISQWIKKSKVKMICINDKADQNDFFKNASRLNELLFEQFPNKSKYEW